MPDDSQFRELLRSPIESEVSTGNRRRWFVGGLTVGSIVVGGLLIFGLGRGDSPAVVPAGSSTTIASVDRTPGYPPSLAYPQMALDPETGLVVMFGGQEGFSNAPSSDVWLFDPTSLDWALGERADPTPPGRSGHALVALDPTHGVALVGGSEGNLQPYCQSQRVFAGTAVDVWTFDASTLTWSQTSSGNAPDDRWGHDVTLTGDGQTLVLFGGSAGPVTQLNPRADTWAYDIEAGTWTQVVTAQAPEPRTCHQMVTDPDTGLIYMFGGELGLSRGTADLWTFDLEKRSWTRIEPTGSSAPEAIWSHQMVYEPNSGLILVIGGVGILTVQTGAGTTTNVGSLDGVWAFDPKTNEWESRQPMPYPLGMHAAVALGDGRVLVHGFGATLIYDVATDTWTDLTPDS